jgi:hypothetical protein
MFPDLTRWTIRLAMLAYVAALALRIASIRQDRRQGDKGRGRQGVEASPTESSPSFDEPRTEDLQRTLWSLGCLLTWAHVLCAFAVHHHWSHAAAYAHTASETARIVGINWGGGIYFNDLFLVLWSADTIWWWLRPACYRSRARSISIFVHTYLAFIAFNATVVFETGPVRYAAVACIVLLAAILTLRS